MEIDREQELIARALRGDLRAYGALVKRYEERLFYTVYRILHHREDAEDCLQEALIKAWEERSSLRDPTSFKAWLYRVLSNTALDRLRGTKRHNEALESYRNEALQFPKVAGATPREALRLARQAERIENAIDGLAPKQKVVFVLRHFQGLKLGEIAEVLDCPVGTVKATLHAALGKLRKTLLSDRERERRNEWSA